MNSVKIFLGRGGSKSHSQLSPGLRPAQTVLLPPFPDLNGISMPRDRMAQLWGWASREGWTQGSQSQGKGSWERKVRAGHLGVGFCLPQSLQPCALRAPSLQILVPFEVKAKAVTPLYRFRKQGSGKSAERPQPQCKSAAGTG